MPQLEKEAQSSAQEGKIICFWGASGAPGRSTLALNFAASLAAMKRSVCLIDADTYSPAQSSLLGMLDDYSSLSQLCHLADRGHLESEKLSEIVSTVKIEKGTLNVVTGITRADRWPEIRSQALEIVIQKLALAYEFVVIDTGFSIEADEELSFDGVAPRRNATTLTALENADSIYFIGAADTLGIPRMMRAVSELISTSIIQIDQSKLHLWINKVRASSIGNQPEQQLLESWERFGPKIPIEGFLPYNQEVVDKSWLTGRTLVECASKADITLAMQSMVEAELAVEAKDVYSRTSMVKDKDKPGTLDGDKKTTRNITSALRKILPGTKAQNQKLEG